MIFFLHSIVPPKNIFSLIKRNNFINSVFCLIVVTILLIRCLSILLENLNLFCVDTIKNINIVVTGMNFLHMVLFLKKNNKTMGNDWKILSQIQNSILFIQTKKLNYSILYTLYK